MSANHDRQPEKHIKPKGPQTQLRTGVHPSHTTWRLLRWLLFLAALLSVVCGGFLLSLKSAEMKCEYATLKIDAQQIKNIGISVAEAFRQYWIILVIILAGIFTFFELFIHSRWKIYAIYAIIAFAAWIFVLYSLNRFKIPEELIKSSGG